MKKGRGIALPYHRLSPALVIIAFLLHSTSGLAITNQDFIGTFTGTVTTTRTACVTPSEDGVSTGQWTVTTFNLNGNNFDFAGSTNSSIDGSTIIFRGSGVISGATSSGSGTLFLSDGTTAIGSFMFNDQLSADGSTLTGTSAGSVFTPGGGCLFTDSKKATRVTADVVVDPAITPSSTITTPQTLQTQVTAITSDLQHRINDVLRTIKLRRQQVPLPRGPREREERESSLFPNGEGQLMVKTREQEDRQSSLLIQPTASGFMMNSILGLNAGDNPWLMGAWASYSYTDFENDFTATAFDGHRHGGLAGLDISPWESVLLGVAVGYEDNDIDTDFNRGNQETDGFTIAPYLGALLTDTWSVNFSFGYSNLDTDQHRTDPVTGARITSSPDSDRWFGMLNLNGLTIYGNWIIGGQIGLLYAKDEQDAYIESNGIRVADFESELGQWNVGGDVAYSFNEFEPFARVLYSNDYSQTKVGVTGSGPQPSFDDDDVLFGAGVRYFGTQGLTGNLEFTTRLDREDYDEYNFTATLRYEW